MLSNSIILLRNSIRKLCSYESKALKIRKLENISQISICPDKDVIIRKIKSDDYDYLLNKFNSYGMFINYCLKQDIRINSYNRRNFMNNYIEKLYKVL